VCTNQSNQRVAGGAAPLAGRRMLPEDTLMMKLRRS
jgi:hypothetical protein